MSSRGYTASKWWNRDLEPRSARANPCSKSMVLKVGTRMLASVQEDSLGCWKLLINCIFKKKQKMKVYQNLVL